MAADLRRFALQAAPAAAMGLYVKLLWPRLGLDMLGREDIWFGLGWAVLLGLPAALRTLRPDRPDTDAQQIFRARICAWGPYGLAAAFACLLPLGERLGNYKLWLGLIYLLAVNLSLAGVALRVRRRLVSHPYHERGAWAWGAVVGAGCGLLLLPWVRPDLVAAWPPSWGPWWPPLVAALCWGVMAGGAPLLVCMAGMGHRAAWVAFLALGLGPGPALAVSWLGPVGPAPLGAGALLVAAMGGLRLWTMRGASHGREPLHPLPLYWLLRALMLLWWGAGLAVTLSVAWWQPRVDLLFLEVHWLRALALGGFLAMCCGVLVEYFLPLLGPGATLRTGRDNPRQFLLTLLALAVALSPLLLLEDRPPVSALDQLEAPQVSLLTQPVILDAAHPEVELEVPDWFISPRRVVLISHLENATAVTQYQVVGQLTAVAPYMAEDGQIVGTSEVPVPYVFTLYAGVDTADRDIQRRDVAVAVGHQPAAIASYHTVHSPTGQSYLALDYLTGLHLWQDVKKLNEIRIVYHPGVDQKADNTYRLVITQVMLY